MRKEKPSKEFIEWLRLNHPEACLKCGKKRHKNLRGLIVCANKECVNYGKEGY